MNLDKLNKWLTLAANLGVIAGIVFLAFELQQNNRFLSAQAQYNLLKDRTEDNTIIMANPEVASLWYKVKINESLTDEEIFRVDAFVVKALLNWQYEYNQYNEGNLTMEELPVNAWRVSYHESNYLMSTSRYPVVWDSIKTVFEPDFVSFMEENVINP